MRHAGMWFVPLANLNGQVSYSLGEIQKDLLFTSISDITSASITAYRMQQKLQFALEQFLLPRKVPLS